MTDNKLFAGYDPQEYNAKIARTLDDYIEAYEVHEGEEVIFGPASKLDCNLYKANYDPRHMPSPYEIKPTKVVPQYHQSPEDRERAIKAVSYKTNIEFLLIDGRCGLSMDGLIEKVFDSMGEAMFCCLCRYGDSLEGGEEMSLYWEHTCTNPECGEHWTCEDHSILWDSDKPERDEHGVLRCPYCLKSEYEISGNQPEAGIHYYDSHK